VIRKKIVMAAIPPERPFMLSKRLKEFVRPMIHRNERSVFRKPHGVNDSSEPPKMTIAAAKV